MSLTRATVEAILINRAGKLLAAAGLDGSTVDGSNAALNDPIGYAVRYLGLTVVNLANVADADLADVAAEDYDQLLDLAEWRTLSNVLGNLDVVNISVGSRSESLGQLSDQVEGMLDRLTTKIENDYGINTGELSAGVISLGFQQSSSNTDVA